MKKVDKKFILNELYSSKVKTCEKCENSSGKQWTQEKKENTNQREFCTSLIFAQAIYSIKLVKWLQLIILPLWFDEKIVRTKSRLFPIKLVKWQQLFLIFLASWTSRVFPAKNGTVGILCPKQLLWLLLMKFLKEKCAL